MIRHLLESLRGAGVTQFQLVAQERAQLAAITPYRVFAQHMTPLQVELMSAPKTELK